MYAPVEVPTPLKGVAESEGVFVHSNCARIREQGSLQKLAGRRDNESVAQVQYVPLHAVKASLVVEDRPVLCHRNTSKSRAARSWWGGGKCRRGGDVGGVVRGDVCIPTSLH